MSRRLPRLIVAAVLAAAAVTTPAQAASRWGGRIFTVGGTGAPPAGPVGDGAPATESGMDPGGVAVMPDGSILVAEFPGRVRRIDRNGIVTTVAGTGRAGHSGDGGPATRARVSFPFDVAALPDGGFLIAEDAAVRRVAPDGTISTVAGTPSSAASSGDGEGGPATSTRVTPTEVSVMADGGFVMAESPWKRVRRVWPDGTITTIVAGEDLYAISVAGLPDGGVLFTDGDRVRRVDPAGRVTTVAGVPGGELTVTPDGGFVVAPQAFEGGGGVFRVAPNHRVTTVVAARAPVASPLANAACAWCGPPRAFLGPAAGDGGLALAARTYGIGPVPPRLAVTGDGGIVVGGDYRVRLIAGSSTAMLGLALGDPAGDRIAATAYTTRVSLSRPARVRLEVRGAGRRLASSVTDVAAPGWVSLRATGPVGSGVRTVRVTASAAVGRGTQARRVVFGGLLRDRWATRLAGGGPAGRIVRRNPATVRLATRVPDADIVERTRAGRCLRLGPRRVDCEIQMSWTYNGPEAEPGSPYGCLKVDAIELGVDGQVRGRSYPCPSARHPGLVKMRPERWLDRASWPYGLEPLS